MTTPVNVNQLFLPSALQIGPGGELITFDASGNPLVIDPNDPLSPLNVNALNVSYDNTTSGLTATDVQGAIDELDNIIDGILGAGGGTLSFLNLADTPVAYAGQAGNAVIVNLTEDGLEFGVPPGGGGGPAVDMEEIILLDGVDYTAGGGGPDTFALPVDPGVIANVWVSFDGIDQFDGFTLGVAPDITFPGGIPVAVSQVRIKIGSTTGGNFDIDSLPAATIQTGDIIAFSGASVGGTESQATTAELAAVLTAEGIGGNITAALDTATYLVTVDYNGTTDDILPVPTPPAGGENELFVFFDGIFQNNTSWALINGGNDIQFDAFIPATVSEVEIRQLVSGGAIPVYMDDAVYTDGVDYTAGGGAETLTLPVNPQTIENVWIYYNGIHQYPDPLDFSVVGTDLNILNGVPAGVSEIYVKVGTTTATAFDIDALPAAGVLTGTDALALSQGGTESQTDLSTLSTFVGTALAGTLGGLIGIQSFTSSGTYNATPGTQAVLVFCTGGGGRSNTSNPSSPGGTSSFGAFCSATGGNTAGNPGTGSGGIINITGGEGLSGGIPSAGESATGGFGGASFWGGGGNAGVPGRNGTAYGSGPGGSTGLTTTGGGSAGGTAIDFITSGFDGTAVTVGAGGFSNGQGSGAPGIVVVFEFG
jgi:hypothetical protein